MKRLFVGLLGMYAVYVTMLLAQPDIQAASDRICVPMYDKTGMECCQ